MLKIMRKYLRCVVHPIVTAYSGVDVKLGRFEIAIIKARHGKATHVTSFCYLFT
jgi:hypothetical protein